MPPLSFSVFEGVAPIRSCTGPHEIGQGGNHFSFPPVAETPGRSAPTGWKSLTPGRRRPAPFQAP